MTAQADTEKVYSAQKKFIWPVACVLALVLGFFIGGMRTSSSCADALDAADDAHYAFSMWLQGASPEEREFWTESARVSMNEYQSAAAKCR